jgi:hypothetical protein
VVDGDAMDAAIEDAAAELTSAGMTSLVDNRQQAYCAYRPALIANLERNRHAKPRAR